MTIDNYDKATVIINKINDIDKEINKLNAACIDGGMLSVFLVDQFGNQFCAIHGSDPIVEFYVGSIRNRLILIKSNLLEELNAI